MRHLLAALVLAAASVPAAAQAVRWGTAIRGTLPGVAGPASFAARNLGGLDLESDYARAVLAPLERYLAAKELSVEIFGALPESKRVALVQAGLEAQVGFVSGRVQGILERVAEEQLSPEQIVDDAQEAEDLLLLGHVFLSPEHKVRLSAAHPLLQKQAASVRARLLEAKLRSTAGAVMRDAEARAEDALGTKPAIDDEALTQAPDAEERREAEEAAAERAATPAFEDALARMRALGALAQKAGKSEEWAAAAKAFEKAYYGGEGRAEARAAVEAVMGDLWEHAHDGFLEQVGKGKRAVPIDATESLEALELALGKTMPHAGKALGAEPTREERTAEAVALLAEMKKRAIAYILDDPKLSAKNYHPKTSAWAAALEPFTGYPSRFQALSADDARDVLMILAPRMKEYRAYLAADKGVTDGVAKSVLAGQPDALVGHLKALAKP